ncbi:MAG: ABC transporter permease [Pelobium sp.]
MIKNYFKIAWRNLLKNKTFSIINILGLATGIAVCLIIVLFVYDELSYDRYNEKASQIVRVTFGGKMGGEVMKESSVMAPVAQAMLNDYPEVEKATRLHSNGMLGKISYGNKNFREKDFASVDANFFEVFTLPFIAGDEKTALTEPNSVVITEEIAKKYFGEEDPMGKLLEFSSLGTTKKVTGVIKNIPLNSHFHFDFFSSMTDVPEARSDSYLSGSFYTYLVLPKGYDYQKLEAKLSTFLDKYMSSQMKVAMGMNIQEFRAKGNDISLHLQPLTAIHLRSDFTNGLEPGGNIQYVYIFSAIAIFMLLIACINFMNLSTAGASKRAKEVGMRKVMGSSPFDLIKQFLFESVFLAFIALIIGLALVKLSLPIFNQLADKSLSLNMLFTVSNIIILIISGLVIGVLAGSYPALFLSSYQPLAVLKSKFNANQKNVSLRSGLVVFQFFVSVLLIVGTIVVYKQLAFIQNKKLGFNKEQVLVLRNTYLLGDKKEILKNELANDPRVLSISNSAFVPVGPTNSNMASTFPEGDKTFIRRTNIYEVDEKYLPTLGMELSSGRNFSKDFPTDSAGVIVNESLANLYGWGENAVGKKINYFTSSEENSFSSYQVLGVVKDFNFKSLHEKIGPMMMILRHSPGLIIKVKPTDVAGLISLISQKWERFNMEEAFSYSFLDDDFNKVYSSEQKTGKILGIFSALTIFVACLGLFGLVTFTAEQRTKEIGVRKTLGANVSQLVALLSGYFLKLVFIACLIAFPLAWFAMNKWLQDFAYHINISVWIFVVAGLLILTIAMITISFQAIKAALANPIKSLRTE